MSKYPNSRQLVAYYVDIIMMLATGRSLGDRVAHTVVICKKDLNSDTNIVTPSDMRDRIEKINSYTNNIPSAKARRKKALYGQLKEFLTAK